MSTHAQYLVGGVVFYTTARAPYHIEFASDSPVKGCRAAQTEVTNGYKSLYHKAGLQFYRKKKCYMGHCSSSNIIIIKKLTAKFAWANWL